MGAWVAQLVKPLTLEFGPGHVVAVGEFETPTRLCSESTDPARILSLSLCRHLSCLITVSLSLSLSLCLSK